MPATSSVQNGEFMFSLMLLEVVAVSTPILKHALHCYHDTFLVLNHKLNIAALFRNAGKFGPCPLVHVTA